MPGDADPGVAEIRITIACTALVTLGLVLHQSKMLLLAYTDLETLKMVYQKHCCLPGDTRTCGVAIGNTAADCIALVTLALMW